MSPEKRRATIADCVLRSAVAAAPNALPATALLPIVFSVAFTPARSDAKPLAPPVLASLARSPRQRRASVKRARTALRCDALRAFCTLREMQSRSLMTRAAETPPI